MNPPALKPPALKPITIGHNGGPPLVEEEMLIDQPDGGWKLSRWRRAHRKAWKTPPREIALRRLELAEQAGMTYRAFTLELKERGYYAHDPKARDARGGGR